MTQGSYVISFNGVWLSEFQFTEDGLTPINSDVKQDAQEFEGMGAVIAALRDIYLWQRISNVDIYEVTVEAV